MKKTYLILIAIMALAIAFVWTSPVQAADDNLTVQYNTVLSTIEHPFLGVNYVALWDSIQGSTASRNALKNAGIEMLRFPGGVPGDWYDWADPYAGGWSSTSTMNLWNYAQGIGSGVKLMLQTNPTANVLGNGLPNDSSGTHAAAWVTYCKNNNIAAPYWEIGNEEDITLTSNYQWTAYQWYLDKFGEQAAAMKAADSTIKILGNVGTNAWYWWALSSLDMFMQTHGNKTGTGLVDAVSLHWYPAPNPATWTDVRASAQGWQANYDYIRSVIQNRDTRNLPLFMSETNAAVGGGGGGDIARTMMCALSNSDMFGAYRESGVQGVQFFGCIHNVSSNWGILYGGADARPPDSPAPTYYILPIWSKVGKTVLSVSGETDPSATLSAYAGKTAAGGNVQVVIHNKTAASRVVAIGFTGFDPTGRNVRIYELKTQTGDVTNQDAYYNGVLMPDPTTTNPLPSPSTGTCTGATYTRTVPAYSLTMVEFVTTSGNTPQASNDSYTVLQNTVLNVPALGVLANDYDADADQLTAIKVTDPSHGSVTLNSNGSFIYTPTTGYAGADSFTYKANDGVLNSNIATVSITVRTNSPPVANNDGYATSKRVQISMPAPGVLANDSDPDGDPLTAVLVSGVSSGTLTFNSDGSFTYKPSANFTGTVSFTYKANDGYVSGNTATATITVYATGVQGPYGAGPWAIPGKVEAENYDVGGANVAYYDATAGNSGGAYRTDDVDVEICGDGGYDVGYIDATEWLEFTVNVASSSFYDLAVRYASMNGGCGLRVEMDGTDVTGAISLGSTGGWQTWASATKTGVSLASGQHVMRIYAITSGFNLNWVEFTGGAAPTIPVAPSGLSATAVSSSQINLAWTDNSNNEDGFRIERKTGAGGTYAEIATVGAGVTTYQSTGLAVSTTYYYRVRAYNTGGNSGYSNEANATTQGPPTIPTAPSGLSATGVSSSQINLAWTDNSTNEEGFRIERKTGAGGTYAEIATVGVGVTTYQNTGLAASTEYYYRVRAYNAAGNSGYSNEANATTLPTAPAAPSGLTATAVSSSQINLAWTDNSTNENGFKIERKTGAGGTYAEIATVGAGVTTYQNTTGLAASTTYYYRVRAYNAGGDSAYSNEANATTWAGAGAWMHVSSIAVVWGPITKSYAQAYATVVIVDAGGSPVSGATVTGTFSGGLNEPGSGTTDGTGTVVITSASWVKQGRGATATFCVNNVTHASFGYDPVANVETCDVTP